ncbi:adenosylcobinamide amidohydrolase [Haloglomus halophilum]|uniref:adenosylcobinamide amidohydrolase n=1 Tax=Haloglomus halophilum TaxID=2962672 RepID=UPI0020C99DE4|nr:adenosylcobinamide amidohydrolase [Haloglomus halophilum]
MSEGDDPPADAGAAVTATVREGVCRVAAPTAWRWLVTGIRGGIRRAPAAYNVTVPEGFDRTDLDAYTRERRREAGFDTDGPALLTGVAMRHARVAVRGPVTVLATGGLSNPATLPLGGAVPPTASGGDDRPPVGTVNLVVATDRALAAGTCAELLATAVEAKTATLLDATGFTGTSSDAVAVGCDPSGAPAEFAGSATGVGAATRACVRDALLASLDARYDGRGNELPDTVAAAEHGVVTDGSARVFAPDGAE